MNIIDIEKYIDAGVHNCANLGILYTNTLEKNTYIVIYYGKRYSRS